MTFFKSALAFFCVSLCMVFPAFAQTQNPFEVDVKVDVTDVNAAKAREKAMQSAMRQAFEIVVNRYVPSSEKAPLLALTDEQMINFIQEISVLTEKTSNVRYLADLKVKINKPIFVAYLQEKNISMVVNEPSKIVVIPIYREFISDAPLLWDDNNLWLQTWQNAEENNNAVTIVPLAPLDVANIDFNAQMALAYNTEVLQAIALNTNASDVFVLDAFFDGIDGFKVNVSSLKARKPFDEIVVGGERKNKQNVMQRALSDVKRKIENQLKQSQTEHSKMQSTLMVIYNYDKLADWVKLEQKLRGVPYVKNLETVAIGDNKVQFKLDVIGDENQVWNAFRRLGMNFKKYDNFYLLEY